MKNAKAEKPAAPKTPLKEVTITLTPDEIALLGALFDSMPVKLSDPKATHITATAHSIIGKINAGLSG